MTKAKTANSTPALETNAVDAPTPPLLLRLEHGVRFANDDTQTLQPRIGASVVVTSLFVDHRHTVWLSADAWEGMATIIRQTPDWHRAHVVEFLRVLEFNLDTKAPIAGLIREMIDEVTDDPYSDVAEDDPRAFDFAW